MNKARDGCRGLRWVGGLLGLKLPELDAHANLSYTSKSRNMPQGTCAQLVARAPGAGAPLSRPADEMSSSIGG